MLKSLNGIVKYNLDEFYHSCVSIIERVIYIGDTAFYCLLYMHIMFINKSAIIILNI